MKDVILLELKLLAGASAGALRFGRVKNVLLLELKPMPGAKGKEQDSFWHGMRMTMTRQLRSTACLRARHSCNAAQLFRY